MTDAGDSFIAHPDKIRIMGRGCRQEVTGLTVNEKCAVSREDIRSFRSLLHRLETKGPNFCTWRGSGERILAKIDGYTAYLKMVDKEKYADLTAEAGTLLIRHGFQHTIRIPAKRAVDAQAPALKNTFFAKLKRLFGR